MIEVITRQDALEALTPELRELWLRSASPTIFTSPDWINAWWTCFGHGDLHALAQRDDGGLLTFAPFFVHRDADDEPELTLVGIGNSDYLDLVASNRRDVTAVMHEILGWSSHHSVRRAEWPQLRHDATLTEADIPPGWRCTLRDSAPSPVVRLPWTDTAFDRQMSPRLQTQLLNARRSAIARGRVWFEHASGDRVEHTLETLFAFHAARLQAAGQPAVLVDPAVQRFHHLVARAADIGGTLRLIRLSIAGETAGVLYGFTTPAGACHYIGGMNPAMADLNPGVLLIREAIHRAIDEGAVEFDFLVGREAYKYQWGARDRRILHCRLRQLQH
jgi:CelD/BcsL family acetyltransferase involved in cellulose biosynthesis